MKTILFARRNLKEILRDPISFFFGLGFPLVLLALLSAINANLPDEAKNQVFAIDNLAPGLAMFGTVFMALFAGMLLAKDRSSSFLMRLFTSPLRAPDFIAGYTLPLLAMALGQGAIVLLASGLAGLPITLHILPALLVVTLVSLLFIGLGLLAGSLMNDKAVGGICGALLTNLAGWLSGIFMPLDLIGGGFVKAAHALPFYHCVEAIKAALKGSLAEIFPHLGIVLVYALPIFLLTILAFRKKMTGENV